MKQYGAKAWLVFGLMTCCYCYGAEEVATNQVSEEKPVAVATVNEKAETHDIAKVSKAFGHMIGKNLNLMGVEFDIEQVLVGIKDSLDGKASPLNEDACIAAITKIQEEDFQKKAQANLAKANAFMEENSQKSGIVEIEKNMVQYKIEKEGSGHVVKQDSTPLVRYTGKFIDGKPFTTLNEEQCVSLQDTMAGFAKGLEGMKEGEKRTVFIHPDRAFGESGYMDPNAALIFDVEVIKADTPESSDLSAGQAEMAVDAEGLKEIPQVN